MRISAGTAAVLGLKKIRMAVIPTTAYLLWGDGCTRRCAFCPQAGGKKNGADRLGRVDWPLFAVSELEAGFSRSGEAGLQRICLQGVWTGRGIPELAALVQRLKTVSALPVCVSAWIDQVREAEELLQAGAERVSIALDAAAPEVYAAIKGGSFERRLELLLTCARRRPGRIVTHLICGLGETERELLALTAELQKEQVTVALFAFTPLKGTALSGRRPPEPAQYRRLQAACYLLRTGLVPFSRFVFSPEGRLLSLGLSLEELQDTLKDGEAFRTSGCPGCNRPYYNERPGGFIYNYPRPLTAAETKEAMALLAAGLDGRGEDGVGKMAAHH